MALADTFLYFAYGSNLLTKRIHKFNPSAVRECVAKLSDYRLDFGIYSEKWKGMVATIVPDEGEHVWGAVWKLNIEDMKNLNRQESVAENIYKPINVEVETADHTKIICHCYELVNQPSKILEGTQVPDDRKPSYSYWNVMVKGAIESRLPHDYIKKLEQIEHNGITADTKDFLNE